jgi:lysophospholipase L1-like esterase
MILGDSIAVGTAMFAPKCAVYAKSGINSSQWNNKYLNQDRLRPEAKTVIISLGSNDHKYVKTEKELQTIRKLARAERVYWILPAIKPDIQEIVKKVAAEYSDVVIPITSLQPDKIHPNWAGYKQIVKDTE